MSSFDIASLFNNNNKNTYGDNNGHPTLSLMPYQSKSSSLLDDKPRKRIRQRVDAGLPRSAYSKTGGGSNSNVMTSPDSSQLISDNDEKRSPDSHAQAPTFYNNNMASFFANNYLQAIYRLQQVKLPAAYQCNGKTDDDKPAAQDSEEVDVERDGDKKVNDSAVNLSIADNADDDVMSVISPTASGSESPLQTSFVSSDPPEGARHADNNVISKDLKALGDKLKSQLAQSLSDVVDKVVSQYLEKDKSSSASSLSMATAGGIPSMMASLPPPPMMPLLPFPTPGSYRFPFHLPQMPPPPTPAYHSAIFPPAYKSAAVLACLNSLANKPSPTGASNMDDLLLRPAPAAQSTPTPMTSSASLSAIFGRKKRTKVTDSRISRMSLKRDLDERKSASPYHHPYHHNSSSSGINGWSRDARSVSAENADMSCMDIDPYDFSDRHTSTLTPLHLRKAKLIFFYARYPTSTLLKSYFPDVRFNKNNTAQLVKWFSNFREFFYIQMEKFAKQYLAQGVTSVDEIQVDMDCELYRSLVVHYSRNNNYVQVPCTFRSVVEATLKEFFIALKSGRDLESSWKKTIYKIIARLDEPIPEYFKTPNFLAQLS